MLAVIENTKDEETKKILTEWYIEYYNIMRKEAYDIVHDYHIANDMVNEAFIRIIKNFSKILPIPCSEKVYYFVYIIRNISRDYMRKYKKTSEFIDFYGDGEEIINKIQNKEYLPDAIHEQIEFYEDLHRYLEKMPEREKMLIICRYVWEMSDKEIGKELGIKEEYVHTYLKRAKDKLIKMINEEDENEA